MLGFFEAPKKARLLKRLMKSPYNAGVDINEKLLTNQHIQYYSGFRQPNLYLKYQELSDEDSDEDSMFGSFNPNLKTKDEFTHRKQSTNKYSGDSKFTLRTGSYMGLFQMAGGLTQEESAIKQNVEFSLGQQIQDHQ